MTTELLEQDIHEPAIAPLLRTDRLPNVWCPMCGIGTVVKCYATALQRRGIDLDKCSIVSGIGCTGRAAGYMKLDGFHTTGLTHDERGYPLMTVECQDACVTRLIGKIADHADEIVRVEEESIADAAVVGVS